MKLNYIFDHVRLSPDFQIGLHTSENWELSLILTGSGSRILGDTEESFAVEDLVLVPPGVPHCWNFNKEDTDRRGMIENLSFFFNDKLLEKLISVFPELMERLIQLKEKRCAVIYSTEKRKQLAEMLLEMDKQDEISRAVTVLELVLALSAAGQCRTISYTPKTDIVEERLSKVRIYVSCNYMNSITIDEISRYVGMHRSAFCVFFRKHTGETFVEYVNAVRLKRACELLMKDEMRISEVCWDCGFKNLSTFSRMFRKIYGESPSEYRQNPEKRI